MILKHYLQRCFALLALILLSTGIVSTARAVNLVQEFYLPMPEAQILKAAETITPAITDTNFAIITSILATGNGTVIYYDQWEDGYEPNLASPTQATTQIWGDGIDTNGICPGFTHDPVGIPAGTVITLSNLVSSPRIPSQVLYDGGDHIAANKALVITRAGWPSPTGPVDGGAAVVLSTLDYGTNFVSPIGQDMPENLFNYVGFFVMAAQDNTTVTIDLDGAGPTPSFNMILNKGQSYLVNGGVKRGGTITTSKPAQADLVCGDTVNNDAIEWFTLYPQSEWSSSYYTPVPSVTNAGTFYTTINYFYNVNPNPITILYSNQLSSGTFSVPANSGAEYPMPTNSGASFTSAGGENFTVLTTVAADPTNNPTASTDATYNWGYTPLPKASLTTEADVGWAPGSSDYSINGSPVWVTPVANTTIYVVYRGTNTPLTDPFGGKYSTNFVLSALQSKAIYVPGTNDQTGMRIYTLDNTLLSVAWGEDPAKAPTGNPGLDLGTSVLPFPIPNVIKSAVIVTDVPPAGLSIGDTIRYTVQTDNKGLLPLGNTIIIDAPSASLSYVTNSTTLDGISIPDSTNGTAFPLDAPGYTIPIILSEGTSVFTYEATVNAGGGVSNSVNIGGTSIIVTNSLPPGYGSNAPAVSIFKTIVSPLSGSAGVNQTVQFNLQIIDTGNTILTNLALADNYPSNVFKFVSASVPVNTTNAGKLTWTNLGSFLPGQETNISVFLQATNASASATNFATASSLFATTNTSSAVITIAGTPASAITASKTLLSPLSGPAGVGQTVQYNLQVVNSGFTTLSNVTLFDNFSATNFSFVSATIAPNTNSGGVLTWTNIGTYSPGQFTNITVSFTVTNYPGTRGATNSMTAKVPGVATNSSSIVLSVSRGALTITKSVLSPPAASAVNIGSNIVFRIIIKNTGLIPVSTLPLEDDYSADTFQFISATLTPSSIGAGDLFWTNLASSGVLAVNATITNDVTMKVVGGSTPALNTAFANYAIDTNGAAIAPASGSVSINTGAGQIAGTVFNDINDSGVFTNGDTGLQNVELDLYTDPNGDGNPSDGTIVQTFTTDVNGNYQLQNLTTGAYVVVETVLPGYAATAPASGRIAINLTSLSTNANNNFFQYQVPSLSYASINGTVWNDTNGSGIFHAGDFGISNVTVDLVQDLNSNGLVDVGESVVQTVFTGTNGAYSFGGVTAGHYVIRETDLASYTSTGDTAPPNDNQIGVNVTAGMITNGNDFFDYFVGAGNTNTQPVAVPDFTNTLENVPVTIFAVANDIATGGFPLTITNASTANGTAAIQNGTNILFTPTASFFGTATINYTVTNGNGGMATALITITVTPVADIRAIKNGPATVFAGTNFNYIITVTNAGPGPASNVVASDTLPLNVAFFSASGGGTTNAGIASWTIGTLAANTASNLTLIVTAPASGSISNTASASSSTTDTNLANNISSQIITVVTPAADLVIAKIGPASVLAKSNFVYNLSVTNFGPSTASGVVVTDALPAGMTFVNASSGGANNSGVVNWSFGTMLASATTNFTLTVTASANGTLTNFAVVSSPTADTNLLNNTNPPAITTVTPIADLVAAKSGPASVFAASNLTYTISVTNLGPSTASGVVVTDALPVGVTFMNASGNGANNSAKVNWSLGNLTVGQTSNLTVTVTAPASGSFVNTATVSSPTIDSNLVNNTSSPVTTTVTPVADVAVIKNGPATIFAGTNFIYTITVTNSGPSTASNIVASDVLPTNIVFVSASIGGTTNAGIASWPIGTLAANASSNLTLTVTAPASGTITNIAMVTTTSGDPNLANNTSPPVTTSVTPVADVGIGKSGPANIFAGTNFIYTISVTNFGPSTASGVVVTDALPAGVTFIFASGNGTTNSGKVNWSLGNLSAGQISNLTLTVTAPANGPITNTAAVGPLSNDPNLTNNTTPPVTTTVTPVADIAIGKSGPATIFAGTNFNYTISVTNFGPSTASGVIATDTLPVGVTFVSASSNGTNNNGVVTWALGALAANATTNLTLNVSAPASGSFTNTATVGPLPNDPNLTNNTSPPVTTSVTPVADVGVGKTAPPSVFAASNLTYTISVTNFGPSTASGVVVTDALPAGVTFVNASGNGTTNAGIVTWSLGNLISGQTSNLTLTVIAPASGTITNIATVGPLPNDPNLTNNTTPPVTTPVTPVADLAALKTGPTNIAAGSGFTYTITITNLGPSTASGVIATDSLPIGVAFVNSSGNGVNNSGTVVWNLGTLAANAATNLTVNVTAPSSGSFTNFALVGSTTGDPNPTNNNGTLLGSQVKTTVSPIADIGIIKIGPANVFAATNFNYTLTVTNAGPSIASNVVASDILPTNVIFVNASGSGTTNAGTVNWPLGNLAIGATTNLTLTVTAPASGIISNTASVNSLTLDTNLVNNTSPPVTTSVTPLADIAVGKVGPAGALFGTNFNYTISVTNFGPSTAATISVTDNLPVGLVFVSSVPAAATNANSQVIWTNIGDLISGATTNLTLTVISTLRTTVTNFASAGSPTLDPTPVNNTNPPAITTITNFPPLANPDNYSIAENSVTNVLAALSNDIVRTPGGVLTIIAVNPTNGTATILGGTNILFTPATNFTGTATIGYTIIDNVGGTNSSLITITVTNIPPVANPDNYSVAENSVGSILTPLVNDIVQTPGGSLTITAVSPTNGTASIVGTNVLFAPATNFTGTATIGYTIIDNIGGTNSSLITVTVTNRPPLANPDNYSVTENTTNVLAPLINDIVQTLGGSLTIIAVAPTNGTATILGGTNVLFLPATNFTGTATIGYTIIDGIGGTNSSLITITVTNIPPLANPDFVDGAENVSSTLTPLTNDVLQTAGGILTIIAVAPTNGTATILGGTNVLFTPATNFIGTATVGYTITDNIGGTNSSLVTVTISNAPPLANPDNYSVSENSVTNLLTPTANDVVQTPGGTLTIISVSPTNGTATISGGTNVLFTPATNFVGTATISYTIIDNVGGTNSSLITVTVTNIPPLANPDNATDTENVSILLTPLTNDIIRTPGGMLTIISVAPTNGTATIIGTNVFFTPATNFTGTATIGYAIIDVIGGTNSSLITITVTNIPPLANPDNYSVGENSVTNLLRPLTNDIVQTPGGTLTIISIAPTNGTASIVGGTNVLFTPATNFTGTATIGYTIIDGIGGTNSSVIIVAITNRPPLANPDNYSVTENTTNVLAPLTNDIVQTPGGSLVIIATNPTNGTATILGGTNVLFTPATNFTGTATIGYTITDSLGGTNSSIITVTVTNVPPLANPDNYSAGENSETNILTPLANDLDQTPGGTLTIISVAPTNGTTTIVGGTNVLFTPTTNFIGTATIGYTIIDGIGGTNSSLITITVTNIPPLANPDNYSAGENSETNILTPLANDLDQTPGGTLTIISVAPTNGTTTIVGGTNVLFTPTTNFIGTATIGYTIIDGIGGTNHSLISVTVTNIPPVANPDNYSIGENSVTNLLRPLTNDIVRTPGGTLTIISVAPTNGTATILGGTNVLFTPTTNFTGTATIGYTITDNRGGTNSSLITVSVTNRPPIANPDSYFVAENSVTNALTPLTNDIVQTPGGILTIIGISPTNGTASIVGGTNILFTPTPDFFGTATIGYTITDSLGGTNSSLITVAVGILQPTANSQSLTVTQNMPATITLTGSDPNSLPLTFFIVTNPTNGTLSNLNTNTGTVIYTPNTNFFGTDSFTFRVNDGLTNSAPATVTLTILPAADIAVLKTGPTNGVAGSNLTYTITVTNRGPTTATNVLVSDQLPVGFAFVSAIPVTATTSNNFVSWPTFNLKNGAHSNFTVTVISAEGGIYTNIAFSTASTVDPNPTNNDGTATNSEVITSVTPRADVAVFKTGGTNVAAGGTVTYTITATNAGPSTATNVVVQDNLPVSATFQGASGSFSQSGNILTWSPMVLAKGASATFNVTVTAPVSGSFVNIASGTSDTPDPNPTNNNGTLPSAKVTTSVVPVADVQVFLFGPSNVTVGDGFSYTIVVSNAGPSTAANTVAQDILPTNLVFVSASGGGLITNKTVTWPVFASLANGQATNLTVTVSPSVLGSTNLFSTTGNPFDFILTNTTSIFGRLTNIASAFATTFDPDLTNNTGTLSPLAQVQTTIVPGVFSVFLATNTYPTNTVVTNTIVPLGGNLFIVGTSAFNPQTGLFEEDVTVTNLGATVVHALRLYVGGLRSGIILYNATGTNNGVPYVEYDPPLGSQYSNSWLYPFPAAAPKISSVTFVLEFFVPDRRAFTNSLTAVAIVPPNAGSTNGTPVVITQQFMDSRNPNDVRFLIDFNSIPGRTYTILYSDDLVTWNIAVPSIVASADQTQWYDDGPPETLSKPASVSSRYYRVILQP